MATITESLSEDYHIPDEVLMEILLRLPLLSLQLFKSVSKHWLSLITSSYFIRRLQKPRIDTPCGLFISKDNSKKKKKRKEDNSEYYDYVTLGPKVTSFPLRATIAEAGSHFDIMQSCNGLLLCSSFVSPRRYYYVYNPFTNLFKKIPIPRFAYHTGTKLAFDPTKSPYYKVVISKRENNRTIQIQIYSSETGKWSICGPPLHEDRFWGFERGIYWNKAIHWINNYENLHSKFDIVDHPMIKNIRTPALNKKGLELTNLFESRGSLLLLMKKDSLRYHVFEMREEASKWSVKYIVDDLITRNIVPDQGKYACFLCIVLGERENDSFMVIESHKKIVRYNFVSKTVSALCNSIRYYNSWGSFPFIASLAGV